MKRVRKKKSANGKASETSAPGADAGTQHISDQQRAEEASRISEQKYKDMFSFAPMGIYQSLPDGTIITANHTLATMLGYESTEELLKLNFERDVYLNPDERGRLIAEWKDSEVAGDVEVAWKRKDGSPIWVQVQAHALKGAKGVTECFEGFVRNVTERREAREALRASEERYRELFENSKDAIYIHDLHGRYTSVNRAAEELSGFTRQEIVGKHYSNFIAPRHLKDARENFCLKLDAPVETTYEAEIACKNGSRKPVEVSSRMIYKDGVAIGVQGIARDISERKRSQELLQTYSRSLIAAQEVERQRIARELHDEIGQTLTAVRLDLQSIQKTFQTEPGLSGIGESVEIVDRALARVRELSLELRPSLLDDLGLAAALRWYAALYTLRSGIAAEVSGDSEVGRIPRDVETACLRIAQEALTNAARHAAATKASVHIERQNGQLCLTIRDNGVGFDSERYLNGSSSASALGLRGMQERALAVRGRVEIHSAPDKGTQIVVRIPIGK